MNRVLMLALLTGGCTIRQAPETPGTCDATEAAQISGQLRHEETGEPLPNALVILQSDRLEGTRETMTNQMGLYGFRELPPGTYTIQVLVGNAHVSKVTSLPEHAKFRGNFWVDPEGEDIGCRLPAMRVLDDASMFSITSEEARLLDVPKTIRRL